MTRQKKFLFSFFSLFFFFWLLVSFGTNIHPDVLDHWGWSQKLAFGYANNSPMISYLMRATSYFISNDIWAIRIGGIGSTLLILIAAYWAARAFLNHQESNFYLLILGANFYFSLLTQFWTIEQPYVFFWFLLLGAWARYINSKKVKWLFASSVFFALGILSKYIIGLFAIIIFFWLLCDKEHRPLLKNPYLYLAALVGIIILLPHLYWNYQRDWITLKFVFYKGIDEQTSWNNLWQVQLSHLFFYSIFFSLPAWLVFFFHKKFSFFNKSKFLLIALHSTIPIIFFSYSSFTGKIADPNWMAAAYISLFLLLAKYFSYLWQANKKKLIFFCYCISYSTVVFLTIFSLLFWHYQFSFIPNTLATRMNEVNGWPQTAKKIETLFAQKNIPLPHYLITKHYQTGGALAFYLKIKYYVTQKEKRELVSKKTITKNKAMIIIRSYAPEDVQKIQKIFPQKWTYLGDVDAIFQKKKLRTFQVWYKE